MTPDPRYTLVEPVVGGDRHWYVRNEKGETLQSDHEDLLPPGIAESSARRLWKLLNGWE